MKRVEVTQEVHHEPSEPQEETFHDDESSPLDRMSNVDEMGDASDNDDDKWAHLSEFSGDYCSDDSDWELLNWGYLSVIVIMKKDLKYFQK